MENLKKHIVKDLGAWLVITNIGRMVSSCIIMIVGAYLIKYDKTPYVFYVALSVFLLHVLVLFIYGIVNMFKEWLR